MGEANFNYDSTCCYNFDVFFDMLSHLVDTIWTNWARLWLAWALWGWGEGAELPSVYMYSLSTTTTPPMAVG